MNLRAWSLKIDNYQVIYEILKHIYHTLLDNLEGLANFADKPPGNHNSKIFISRKAPMCTSRAAKMRNRQEAGIGQQDWELWDSTYNNNSWQTIINRYSFSFFLSKSCFTTMLINSHFGANSLRKLCNMAVPQFLYLYRKDKGNLTV